MLSGLPKLLGKNFIIGYLLPATLFMWLLSAMLAAFDIQAPALVIPTADNLAELVKLIETSFFVILLSIFLLAFNQRLDRLLQGYSHVMKFLGEARAKRQFSRDIAPVLAEMKKIDEANRLSDKRVHSDMEGFVEKLGKAARDYPDEEKWVLPTRFGNVSRATEVYPRVVYGLDGVPAWPHLLMLISKEVDEQLKDRRSIIDFLMNTFVLSAVLAAAYLALAAVNCSLSAPWIPLLLLASVLFTWKSLPLAALEWGYTARAVYDLYRPDLAKKLGLKLPPTAEAEFLFWQQVSRTMIFRSHDSFRSNNEWRQPGGGDTAASSGKKDK